MITLSIVYILPGIITLIAALLWGLKSFHEMRESSDQCPTIGQVSSTIGLFAVAFIPALNFVAALMFIIHMCYEYHWEIEDFFNKPICFWRKKA